MGDFLPSLEEYAWRLVKGDADSSYYTGSPAPRVPGESYTVAVSAADVFGFPYYPAEPLVEGGKIFLHDTNGVYALNRTSGELIWGVEVFFDDLHDRGLVERWRALGLYRFVATYGLGKALYVATTGNGGGAMLLAFDKEDGDLLWSSELDSEAAYSNMVVADGRIYVGTLDGKVYCFSEAGEHLWTASLGGRSVRGLAYGKNTLYVSIEDEKELYALDAGDGSTTWVYSHENPVNSPLYTGTAIIFVDGQGNVVAVSEEGRVLWRASAGAGSTFLGDSLLAMGGEAMYVSVGLGEVNGLRTLSRGGEEAGLYKLPEGETPCQPVAAGPLVVLPTVSEQYSKIYVLWRGTAKLYEKEYRGEENFCPRAAVAHGEVFVVFPETRGVHALVRLADSEAPRILGVSQPGRVLEGEEVEINATITDPGSALYKAVLAYRVDQGAWSLAEMMPGKEYAGEPVGGYGFGEETYIVSIPAQQAGSRVEYRVVAIDNVGNVAYSDTYTYVVEALAETTTITGTQIATTSTPTTTLTTAEPSTATAKAPAAEKPLLWITGLAALSMLMVALYLYHRHAGGAG